MRSGAFWWTGDRSASRAWVFFAYLAFDSDFSHCMFDSPDYPKPLDEATFDAWLEEGRSNKIAYAYMLIVWDEVEEKYFPDYVENRSGIQQYERYGDSPARQLLVAAYDLYSESKVV
jgi:hypothetical protein